jgi:putative SOS response-associated peptidase YedK
MCGRAALSTPPEDLAELFGLEPPTVAWPARYNIAPTDPVAVIRREGSGGSQAKRVLGVMRWGLVPSFAKDVRGGASLINARVESLAQRGVFKKALASRRCLVVVDGFYEWTHDKPRRTPRYVKRVDGRPMTLAGLWDAWQSPEGTRLESCTIVTTAANAKIAEIHDRMPLCVSPALIDEWLDPTRTTTEDLARVLQAKVAEEELESFTVHPRVNQVGADDPLNIVPFELQRTLFG